MKRFFWKKKNLFVEILKKTMDNFHYFKIYFDFFSLR